MKNIVTWKQEVNTYNESFGELLEEKSNYKDKYYGFEVIDGQLKENPLILFIGINPGRGDETIKRNVFETERISYLDVYNDDYKEDYKKGYHLAEKTLNFFKELGWDKEQIKNVFQNQVVKTNFYHLATKDVDDLNIILNDINSIGDYFKKSAAFAIDLIDILQPKIVILEGKKVFDNIVEECYELKKWDQEKGFGYLYDNEKNVHIIGYNRRNFSINQRNQFTAKLKEIL